MSAFVRTKLAPIGFYKSGRPIYPIMGGSEAATEGQVAAAVAAAGQQTELAPQAGQQQAAAPQAPKPQAPAAQQQTEPQAPPADETPEAKAARLEAEVTKLRRENGSQRVTAKQKAAEDAKAELAQEIGKALGLIKDEQTVDPGVLTQQIQAEQAKSRMAEVKLAVFQNAGDADPARLLDSTSFLESIKDVKPDDIDGIKAAIKASTDANPYLKSTSAQAAGKSGTDFSGGTGEQRAKQPKSLQDAVANHYGA